MTRPRQRPRPRPRPRPGPRPRILVVDVGGTHVKVLCTGHRVSRRFDSGPTMTAAQMVIGVLALVRGWRYDCVSIGYPGPVLHGKPVREPHNLGEGWVGFDFAAAFGCPVKVVNDAAMQALGSYEGGTMLFLGLGTGLGSAMIVDGTVEAMELAHLPYRKGRSYEAYLGDRARKRRGKKKWRRSVRDVVTLLRDALRPDYVTLGGGNAKRLTSLPAHTRVVTNDSAFRGGFRLWNEPRATDG